MNKTGFVVALGQFDGVHKGHQCLIKKAIKVAQSSNLLASAMLFDPLPRAILTQDFNPIQTYEARRRSMLSYGLDFVHELKINKNFLSKSAAEFMLYLKDIGVAEVVIGSDFKFGHQRQGDHFALRSEFLVHVVPTKLLQQRRISSTWCRELILSHDFSGYKQLVGRPWQIDVNLFNGISEERLDVLLPLGYEGRATIEAQGIKYNALVNIASDKICCDLVLDGKSAILLD